MSSGVTEKVDQLGDGLLDPSALARLGQDADVLVLPERLTTTQDGTTAAYERSTYLLREVAKLSNVRLDLATPPDALPGVWQAHEATLVLPVLLSIPATVAANLVAELLLSRIRGDRQITKVKYREAHLEADGSAHVRELEGPVEAVLEILSREAAASSDESNSS